MMEIPTHPKSEARENRLESRKFQLKLIREIAYQIREALIHLPKAAENLGTTNEAPTTPSRRVRLSDSKEATWRRLRMDFFEPIRHGWREPLQHRKAFPESMDR